MLIEIDKRNRMNRCEINLFQNRSYCFIVSCIFNAGMQELDCHLGPYPFDNVKKWVSLTQYITEPLLERIQPQCKKLSSVSEVPQEPFQTKRGNKGHCAKANIEAKAKSSVTEYLSDNAIRFTKVAKQAYPGGASPAEITKYSIDSSYVLNCMLQSMTG